MTSIQSTHTATRSERTLRTILIADLERYRDATTITWNKRWAQKLIDEQQKLQSTLDQNKQSSPPTARGSITVGVGTSIPSIPLEDVRIARATTQAQRYGLLKCSRCGVTAKQGIPLQTKCTGRFTYHDMRPL